LGRPADFIFQSSFSGPHFPPQGIKDGLGPVEGGGEFVLLDGAGGIDVLGADAGAFADESAAPDGVVLGENGESVFGTLIAGVEIVALGKRDGGGAGEERV